MSGRTCEANSPSGASVCPEMFWHRRLDAGMIYGASALKLADGGAIKWLFMFQRRVFTVKRGGALF